MDITILDNNTNKDKILDVLDSFIWTDRYSRYGDFEIFTEATPQIVSFLKEDQYLTIPESEHVMIVESVELKTDIEEGTKFIAKGRSLESILERRIVWKQTVLSGSLQNGIQRLLEENAINPDDPDRKITRLIFKPSTDIKILSLPIDNQYSGEDLYSVIQGLCETNGIGFRITLSSGNFVFSLYSGEDRSFSQIENPFVSFSPDLENLSQTNYFHTKIPYRTITLVAGEGEGSDRKTAQVALPGIENRDLNRREKFTDARDISSLVDGVEISEAEYNTLLIQKGILSLLESQPQSSFDGKIDATTTYRYGVDFFIGDIVQIANEFGLTGKSRVTELVFSEDLSGRDIYPTFEMIE